MALLYDDSGTLHQHRQKGQRTGLLFSIGVYFPMKTREGLSFRAQKGLLGSWTRALWRLGRVLSVLPVMLETFFLFCL